MAEDRLRITHYFPAIRLADGGMARTVLDWCKVFASRGHTVCLVCDDSADVPGEWLGQLSGVPRVVVVPKVGRLTRLFRTFQASEVEQSILRQTDILHLHAPWHVGNLRFARGARRLGIPYVLSVHGMLDDWSMRQRSLKKRTYLALVGRRLLNRAAAVHFTAEAERSQAGKWFDNRHTAVLPCLVDLSPFEHLPGPEAGLRLIPSAGRQKRKILFLSRLHEKKGVDLLIRASLLLRDGGTEAVTLIAGTGDPAYEKYLRDLVAELKLSDQVMFLGLVTGQEKISLYQAVDLLVLPTQQENFGLVLIEAMACATPVLTTRGTDIWNEIQTAGAIIAERTPQAFAEEITKLLENPQDRAQRGLRGREWVFSTLAVEPLSQKYESLYRRLIGS